MNGKCAMAMALAGVLAGVSLAILPGVRGVTELELYASNNGGWGKDPGNMTKPGPLLTFTNGTQLHLTLHSQDGNAHNFYVDYNNDRTNASEPSSGTFSTSGPNSFPLITLNREGNFTYRCFFHNAMTGSINVTASTGGGLPGGGGGTLLDYTLLYIILGVVAAAAALVVLLMVRTRHRPPAGP